MTKRLDCNQMVPDGAKAFDGVYGYVMQSGLPSELVDAICLRISQINNCAYCHDMYTHDLTEKGVEVEKPTLVQAWREGGGLFSAAERAAHSWAESVTRVAETGASGSAR